MITTTPENLHQLTQQVLLLCMQVSQRGLASAWLTFGGCTNSIGCSAYPVDYSFSAEEDAQLLEGHDGKYLALFHKMVLLQKADAEVQLLDLRSKLSELLANGQAITVESLARAAA